MDLETALVLRSEDVGCMVYVKDGDILDQGDPDIMNVIKELEKGTELVLSSSDKDHYNRTYLKVRRGRWKCIEEIYEDF